MPSKHFYSKKFTSWALNLAIHFCIMIVYCSHHHRYSVMLVQFLHYRYLTMLMWDYCRFDHCLCCTLRCKNNPSFLHLHNMPNPSALHPRDSMLSRESGAAGSSVSTGGKKLSCDLQPYSVGGKGFSIYFWTVR